MRAIGVSGWLAALWWATPGADVSVASNLEDLVHFASELESQSDYYRAIGVWKQVEYEGRGGRLGAVAYRRVLRILSSFEEWEQVDGWLEQGLKFHSALYAGPQWRILRGEVYARMGNYSGMREILRSELEACGRSDVADPGPDDEDCVHAGRLLAYGGFMAKDWAYLHDLSEGFSHRIATDTRSRLSDSLARWEGLPRKKAGLGALLSIVPGGGQLYAGRIGGAVGSFLLNGLLGGVFALSIRDSETGLTVFSGLVLAGFYAGNVYSGWEAVRRVTLQSEREFQSDLPKSLDLRWRLPTSMSDPGDSESPLPME